MSLISKGMGSQNLILTKGLGAIFTFLTPSHWLVNKVMRSRVNLFKITRIIQEDEFGQVLRKTSYGYKTRAVIGTIPFEHFLVKRGIVEWGTPMFYLPAYKEDIRPEIGDEIEFKDKFYIIQRVDADEFKSKSHTFLIWTCYCKEITLTD